MHVYQVASVMYHSLRPDGLLPTRLLCPQDSPGKNTGVVCHALLQGIFLTQGWNQHLLCLLHCQAGSLPLAPLINKRLLNAYWFQALGCVYTQSCLTLYDPMDYSPPGSSAHGIFQARILEWIAISSSRGFF